MKNIFLYDFKRKLHKTLTINVYSESTLYTYGIYVTVTAQRGQQRDIGELFLYTIKIKLPLKAIKETRELKLHIRKYF